MNVLAISELRSNLSSHLENVKTTNSPIVFWERHRKEFLITPYPDTKEESDIFNIPNLLEDKVIENEYNKWISNNMSDWLDDIHDDLFE